VWVGALVTAVLFSVGEYVISIYLERGNITRGYGEASGAFLALLVWVYYSAIIFFFGAEVTQQYAQLTHTAIKPTGHARRVAKIEEQDAAAQSAGASA
ncbi:MAG TPA: YhjD/YihY/BrkB family envelope integrity protein, partial [Phycisphaerae bacterium]|nr:YhjD/YihY/BrkB family envelope integrity protein [Phycisphaerae bacterium]